MTNEEAIKYLIQPVATSTIPCDEFVKQMTAWSMAVRALNEEPKHGRWIFTQDETWYAEFQCSECKEGVCNKTKFCPNCGARMDGQNDE